MRRKEAGALRLISLLAPARSSSTALERALLGSPDISLQVNDPFAIYDDAGREEKTYRYIFDRLEAQAKADGKQCTVALVKNVADYIPPGAAWERWRALCAAQVFLVRNPLLTMPSLFRMLARHFTPAELDADAPQFGFVNGEALRAALSGAEDFSPYDDLFRRLFTRDQKIHHDPVMCLPLLEALSADRAKDAGYKNLDELGRALGDADWEATLGRLQRDRTLDNPLLAKIFAQIFAWRITGWEALEEHFNEAPGAVIMDSSLFRSAPELAMRSLCRSLDIRYAVDMQVWTEQPGKRFTTDYDGEIPYYDRVTHSQKIDPPLERPFPVAAFPPSFRPHITGSGGCLHIYLRLLRALEPDLVRQYSIPAALRDIDPVFCTALALATGEPSVPPAGPFADAIGALNQLAAAPRPPILRPA
ncbi:MAG TPA: hypothetical protein VEF76_08690 [Patescibacteria group bacterium]|nr:hypothetical protein [Patescibacteria group bacterium]